MNQITYEITATVEADVAGEYETYMIETHIPDVMATGELMSAIFSRSGECRYRIRYEARDRAALDRYFADHAPGLRADLVERFPAGVEHSREEWDVIATFSSDQKR